MGTHAEVLESLAGVLGTAEDQGVAASGRTESKLVQGDGLTAGGDDASTGGGGESESGHGELRELQEAVVVGDGADNDDGALLLLGDVRGDSRQGHRRAVHLGHKEASEDNLVEGRIGTAWKTRGLLTSSGFISMLGRCVGRTGQEAVKLHQELEVDIVALGGLAVSALDVVAVEIDTCWVKPSSAIWSEVCSIRAALSGDIQTAPHPQGNWFSRNPSPHSHTKAERKMLHVPMAAVGRWRWRWVPGVDGVRASSSDFEGKFRATTPDVSEWVIPLAKNWAVSPRLGHNLLT